MEELKAMFCVCAHIKSDGIRCNSPAMKGMNFCFQHIGGKPMAFVRAEATTTYKTNLNLAHPGTREAIQHNLSLIAQALNDGKLDAQTANSYIRLYRIAEQNLTRWERTNKDNPEKHMQPLPLEEHDVILSERHAQSEESAFPPNDGGPFKRSLNGPQNSKPETEPEPAPPVSSVNSGVNPSAAKSAEPRESNEAIAAKHAAHMGRPLNELERQYFGLPPAPSNERPASPLIAP